MPFMTTLGLILGGAGAVKQFIDGTKAKSSGEKRLADLRQPELTNLAKNLKPSFEQERQALARISQQEQTIADVASGMDAASAMGLLQSGFTQTGQSRMDIYGSNVEKQFQNDLLAVQEDQAIRGIMENRYNTEILLKRQNKLDKAEGTTGNKEDSQTPVSKGLRLMIFQETDKNYVMLVKGFLTLMLVVLLSFYLNSCSSYLVVYLEVKDKRWQKEQE